MWYVPLWRRAEKMQTKDDVTEWWLFLNITGWGKRMQYGETISNFITKCNMSRETDWLWWSFKIIIKKTSLNTILCIWLIIHSYHYTCCVADFFPTDALERAITEAPWIQTRGSLQALCEKYNHVNLLKTWFYACSFITCPFWQFALVASQLTAITVS